MSEWKFGDDQIVITGIAGKFPGSPDVKALKENLLANKDLFTEEHGRWQIKSKHFTNKIGVVDGVNKFDNTFFGVHQKLTEQLDPMTRMIIEACYEAVADSGYNPQDLRNSNTAVFTGSGFSESEKVMFYEKVEMNGFGLLGCSRAMLANRISFSLGLTGPSINMDAACCASGQALDEACRLIKSGQTDGVIVGGSNLALHPQFSYHLAALGVLSPDGLTRPFDAKANGYTRSETVTAIFLQRGSVARRVYAEILASSTLNVPSIPVNNSMAYATVDQQVRIMEETLKKSGLSPTDVTYIEADGSAIKFADKDEVEAIDRVYSKGRKTPLLIGSVKSNLGHAMGSNTINSILKVIFSMESGVIPATLNYEKPPADVEPLVKGRLKVVAKNTPWKGDYVAINSISFSGNFSHIILKAFRKPLANNGVPKDTLDRLVTFSGRTVEACATILTELQAKPCNAEFVQLMHNLFERQTTKHLYRGFALLPPEGLPTKSMDIEEVESVNRPVWYIFSGMGSQWVGMGKMLMKIPVFAAAVKKCDKALRPHGIDIVRIITDNDKTMFDNIVNSFVGIATVQIGLVDVLKTIGLEPDMIIGHSVGELGCAYADGCFTAEEMVLSALSRGLASKESNLMKGSMAAVGLGYHDIHPMCPPDIDVACHNGPESTTISGPAESMTKFVAQLQAKGIFAREVPCSNIAYHSRYIAPAAPKLMEYLQKVIKDPKPRSSRWVSSSVPRSEWDSPKAKFSGPEYHTNNLLSPVLFAETSRLIPKNAIAIEIAPHGLLQAIVRKSLHPEVINVPLTLRGHIDNSHFLLQALGKLHNSGLQIYPSRLYEQAEFPLSANLPHLSALIKWNHQQDRYVNYFEEKDPTVEGEKVFKINLNDNKYGHLKHHKINGEVVIPWPLYLIMGWEIWSSIRVTKSEKNVITFENIKFKEPVTVLDIDDVLEMTVMVQKGTGRFEVTCNNVFLASGSILTDVEEPLIKVRKLNENIQNPLTEDDIYTELAMKGFDYGKSFRNLNKVSRDGLDGMVNWTDDWSTFLISLMQLWNFSEDTRDILVPVAIRKLVIDVNKHRESVGRSRVFPVAADKYVNVISTNGVQIEGIQLSSVGVKSSQIFVVDTPTPFAPKKLNLSTVVATQQILGDPSSITWAPGPTIQSDKNTVKVEYAALNVHDFQKAQSNVSIAKTEEDRVKEKHFGLEYAGRDSTNKPVMGICEQGSLSSHVTMDPILTWPLPLIWTTEEAATMPLSYAVAYSTLVFKAEIAKGDRVLIQNGATDFGQAMLNVALEKGCVVYTSYAKLEEKKFLKTRYPTIPDHRIMDASETFVGKLWKDSKLHGMDVAVVQTHVSDLGAVEDTIQCVRASGRILIVGDMEPGLFTSIGMEIFLREMGLFSVIPRQIACAEAYTKQVLATLVKSGIESGAVKPLSRTVYSSEALNDAFLDGIANKNHGKILVKIPEPKAVQSNVAPRFVASSSKSYLIVEGLSNFGLEVADWLVSRGATTIVLASENNRRKNYVDFRMQLWQNHGATVLLKENVNLKSKQGVKTLLDEVNKLAQLDGVFDLSKNCEITRVLDEEHNGNLVVCVAMTKADKKWQDVVAKEKQVEQLVTKRVKNGLSGMMVVCTAKDGELDFKNLQIFDEVLLTTSPVVAVVQRTVQKEKTLVQKQDTDNRDADINENEATKFKNGLYMTEKISDRFSFLPV